MEVNKLIIAGASLADLEKKIADSFKVWFVDEEQSLVPTIKKVNPSIIIASLREIVHFDLIRQFYRGFILGVVTDQPASAYPSIDDFILYDELTRGELKTVLDRACKKVKMNCHMDKIDNQINLLSNGKKR